MDIVTPGGQIMRCRRGTDWELIGEVEVKRIMRGKEMDIVKTVTNCYNNNFPLFLSFFQQCSANRQNYSNQHPNDVFSRNPTV